MTYWSRVIGTSRTADCRRWRNPEAKLRALSRPGNKPETQGATVLTSCNATETDLGRIPLSG
jgi:hypothetical protein